MPTDRANMMPSAPSPPVCRPTTLFVAVQQHNPPGVISLGANPDMHGFADVSIGSIVLGTVADRFEQHGV